MYWRLQTVRASIELLAKALLSSEEERWDRLCVTASRRWYLSCLFHRHSYSSVEKRGLLVVAWGWVLRGGAHIIPQNATLTSCGVCAIWRIHAISPACALSGNLRIHIVTEYAARCRIIDMQGKCGQCGRFVRLSGSSETVVVLHPCAGAESTSASQQCVGGLRVWQDWPCVPRTECGNVAMEENTEAARRFAYILPDLCGKLLLQL